MICKAFETYTLKKYKYVVIFAKFENKWILCNHKNRTTWETSGGHIEIGESPIEAAKRELYEETGSVEFDIVPICDYYTVDERCETEYDMQSNGMVFLADVRRLGDLPKSEMARIDFFENLPENLTYKDITDVIFPYAAKKILR